MKTISIIDAVGQLEPELLSDHLKQKKKVEDKMNRKMKISVVACAALAACAALVLCIVPVVKLIMRGGNEKAPVTVEYTNVKEAHDTLGNETLLSKAETDAKVSVSYASDSEGAADVTKPIQMKVRKAIPDGSAYYYVLFGKKDPKDCYIAGYEEQGLKKEIGGISVQYSMISDGANHFQARFVSGNNLYVIDVVSKGEIDPDTYLLPLLS